MLIQGTEDLDGRMEGMAASIPGKDSLLDLDYITSPVVNADKREGEMPCMYLCKSFLVALLSLDAPQQELSRIEGE
jgi:hypothetical protein